MLGLLVIGGVAGGIIFYRRKQSGNSFGTIASEGSAYYGGNGERVEGSAAVPQTSQYSSAYPKSTRGDVRSELEFSPAQSYDNVGVTIEDDDMMLTAM